MNNELIILRTMLTCRYCDMIEQDYVRQGKAGFHVSAMGHESLASVAYLLSEGDLVFCYYRDRAIALARGITPNDLAADFFGRVGGTTQGRQMPCHFTSRMHGIFSVSTPTASQLLPACGAAWGIKLDGLPRVVVATIGDASTRQGDFFEAICFAQERALPILFVVEDNGYGISTPTNSTHPLALGILAKERWQEAEGQYVEDVQAKSRTAIDAIRRGGGPQFLWCRMERLTDHTNSDDQRLYRPQSELATLKDRDPVECYKHKIVRKGILRQEELIRLENEIKSEIEKVYFEAQQLPKPSPDVLQCEVTSIPQEIDFEVLPEGRMNLVGAIRKTLEKGLCLDASRVIFGQDVADPKGGVFTLTKGLSTAYPKQVFNAPLAESTILGVACGLAAYGKRPIFEIQFVDFIHVGWNQLVSNLATLRWRSYGDWKCPVVIYAPYGAYIRGGGLWHSQANESAIAHYPGINVVVPSNPEDAAGLLWSAMNIDDPTIILLPKHLFWKEMNVSSNIPAIPLGCAKVRRGGEDITVVAWGNCVEVVEAAARLIEDQVGIEIIDLRSIVPWDVQTVITSVCKTGRLLIVQEDTENCSVGQMIVTTIASMEKVWRCLIAPPRLLSKPNVMIGFSEIYENAALPTSEKVVKAIFDLHVIKCLPLDHMSNKTRDVVPMDSLDNISPIILPFFGEGIDRASVLELYKKPGDKIQIGDVVAEMETDKAVFSVAAQEAGVLNHWKVVIGQKLQAGAILGEVVMENTQKTLKATPVKQGYSKTLLAKMRDVVLANAQIVFEWTAVRQAIESLNKNRGSAIATPTSIVAWCTAKTMLNHSAFRLQATDGTDAPAKTGLGIAVECKNGELGLAVIANTTDITIDEFLESYANNVNATRNGRIDATATPLHISSLIHHGIRAATPLVAPPALATLFVGEVFLESKYSDPPSKNEREVVLLSLSFDQRFIAGLQAVSFLGELRNNLENCNFP